MKMHLNNRLVLKALGGFVAVGLSASCGTTISDEGISYSSSQPPMPTSFISNSYVTDVNDLRKLAGISDAIFVGRVIGQESSKALSAVPETQFRVTVLTALKGDLEPEIIVNQQGGVDARSKQVILVEGDELVEPGESYLFATRYLASENWYTLIPVVGDKLLSDQEANAAANPEASAIQSKLITDMTGAIANQIPFP